MELIYMDRKALIKKLESELRQAHQDYLDGKCIPIEDLDWGLPMYITEPKSKHNMHNEVCII